NHFFPGEPLAEWSSRRLVSRWSPARMMGEDGAAVQVGAGQQAQFAEDRRVHFLGFVDEQHGPIDGGGRRSIGFAGFELLFSTRRFAPAVRATSLSKFSRVSRCCFSNFCSIERTEPRPQSEPDLRICGWTAPL